MTFFLSFITPLFIKIGKKPNNAYEFRNNSVTKLRSKCCPTDITCCSSSQKIYPSPYSIEALTAAHPLTKRYPTNRNEPVSGLSPRHFINLTNGIQCLPDIELLIANEELRFTRIQSSHCESGSYDKILASLDYELLFSLACGRYCYIYDLASRNKARGVPRAIFLGVEFIKWSLAYLWFGVDRPELVPTRVMVRGKNTVPFWRDKVLPYKISKSSKKRLRYFQPFVEEMAVDEVRLSGVYGRATEIDGCKGIHVKMVRSWLEQLPHLVGDDHMLRWLADNGYALYDAECSEEELIQTHERLGRAGDGASEEDNSDDSGRSG